MILRKRIAFSLVEILVALIIISLIMAALTPVITKRLTSDSIVVGMSSSSGGGAIGNDVTTECSEKFSEDCKLCYPGACLDCKKNCNSGEFKNVSLCTCENCIDLYGEQCLDCNANACTKCNTGFGISSNGKCQDCSEINGYSNGYEICKPCPAGTYCENGIMTSCPVGSWSNEASNSCFSCSTVVPNCATCASETICSSCELGFTLQNNSCNYALEEKIYKEAGTYEFKIPDDVKKIIVTMVSGGGGGGSGATIAKSILFRASSSADGNFANNSINSQRYEADGIMTWNIPTYAQGKNIKFTACGGGGGGGAGYGGNGGYVENAILNTNETLLEIQVGGGGGAGQANDNGGAGGSGGCPLGGGGGGSFGDYNSNYAALSSSCYSSGNYGRGHWGNDAVQYNGYGGWDPMFGEHGKNGGAGCGSNCSGTGGTGSYFAGGGAGGDMGVGGGGGGAPTLFRHTEYAKMAKYVAGGGGGGRGGCGGAGGGGGITGGSCRSDGVNGKAGAYTIFGSNYCTGGLGASQGKPGAMYLYYIEIGTTNGTGGGGGQIVPRKEINVIPGEVLTIIVGKGGEGGKALRYEDDATFINTPNGEGKNENIISKILDSSGATLATTAINYVVSGASGGSNDGTTIGEKGIITDGFGEIIESEGNESTNGEAATSEYGGMGGRVKIAGEWAPCLPGSPGAKEQNGYDASGYGGCGGGGGGAGADGGKGADGYIKLEMVRE